MMDFSCRGAARRRLLAVAALLSALAGCAAFHPTKDRLEPMRLASPCPGRADTLLVFLPGRYDVPDDIVGHGFVAALQAAGAHADVAIPDLHLGYYLEGSAVTRLREDIVLPARRAGYRHIWFAGISLGGLGALLYLRQHPREADGAFLIAPYLGEDAIRRDIAAAGGLERWTGAAPGAREEERRLWLWLRETAPRAGRPGWPQLYLGHGRQDRFADIDALLAAALPPGHAAATAGGHDWAPWLRIWNTMLARGALPECAALHQAVPGS
jgi:hypothetical protein